MMKTKNVQSRINFRTVIAAEAILGLVAGCAEKGKPFEEFDLLGGLEPLSVPRSNILIGASWQRGIGPVSGSLRDPDLRKSIGVSDAVLSGNSHLRANFVVSLAHTLGPNVFANYHDADDFRLATRDVAQKGENS